MIITADPPIQVAKLQDSRNDPWYFLTHCVFTLDQTDTLQPIKKFRTEPYIEYMVRAIHSESLLALVKHRRLFMTWSGMGVCLHDAMFHEGRTIGVISKKEEDSDELVRRCKFMYDNIPESELPVKPKAIYTYCKLRLPEIDSEIRGFPQGPDQLRQLTLSRIWADEIAFWEKARASFVAMKPTLEGGGKITLTSTRYPGFFKELIEDALDD